MMAEVETSEPVPQNHMPGGPAGAPAATARQPIAAAAHVLRRRRRGDITGRRRASNFAISKRLVVLALPQ